MFIPLLRNGSALVRHRIYVAGDKLAAVTHNCDRTAPPFRSMDVTSISSTMHLRVSAFDDVNVLQLACEHLLIALHHWLAPTRYTGAATGAPVAPPSTTISAPVTKESFVGRQRKCGSRDFLRFTHTA
ncbi:MAG: hypothetical protein QOJ99_2513 [Bryobacterales bacterium]|nr:hypothetical protein [Bryobacterales bacterium]